MSTFFQDEQNLPNLRHNARSARPTPILATQRAARALARRLDEALRTIGLTNGLFSLLMSLNQPTSSMMSSLAALHSPFHLLGLLVLRLFREAKRIDCARIGSIIRDRCIDPRFAAATVAR